MYKFDTFSVKDIFKLNYINLDNFTENFRFDYYIYYLNKNLENFSLCKNDYIVGYIFGKLEIKNNHVSALSVSPNYRSKLVSYYLMKIFEDNYKVSYVDLFVRSSNTRARKFYYKLGYKETGRVLEYFSNPVESAIDCRKYL